MTEFPHIAVTSVMSNRAWCLPWFLGALAGLDYPAEQLSFHFIDDGSTDATPELLKAFRAKYRKTFRDVEIVTKKWGNPATSARDTDDRGKGYPRLAQLRNEALDLAIASGAAGQLSIDSDILAGPGLLKGLMSHGKGYVASLIFNDIDRDKCHIALGVPITGRYSNSGGLHQGHWKPFKGYELNKLYACGYSGAVYYIDAATLHSGARFGGENPDPVHSCEDYSYCWALQRLGIDRYIDTTLRAVHLQVPACLQEGLGVFYAWFGRLPEEVRP
jgi:glycosyltransferase involved in cell wall biosynthesis